MSSRTTRSAWARTDRPTSRSSNSLLCEHPRPHHAPPCRRQRGRRSVARHHRAPASAGLSGAEPSGAADLRPHALCAGRRCRAGRLCSRRAPDGKPAVILIGTGSEVALCVDAYEELKRQGIPARVVSMPSWELFEQQDQAYRDGVLPPNVTARVSVEMGSVIGWDRYVGRPAPRSACTHSAPRRRSKTCSTKFGFTPAKVLAAAKEQIEKSKGTT